MNDGVTSGLTDHQVGPLHDDDGHKERGVARVLQHLPLCVRLYKRERNNDLTYYFLFDIVTLLMEIQQKR